MESRNAGKSGSFKSIHEPQPHSPTANRSEPSSLGDGEEFVCIDTERTKIFADVTSPASDVTGSQSDSPHLSPSPLQISHVSHHFMAESPSAGLGAQNPLSPKSGLPSPLSIQIRALTPSQQLEVMLSDDNDTHVEATEAKAKLPQTQIGHSASSLAPPPSDLRQRPSSELMPGLAPNRRRLSVVEIKQNQEAAKKSSIFSCCNCFKGLGLFSSPKAKVEDNTSSTDLEMPATLGYAFPVSQPTTPDADAGRGRVHQI